MIIYERTDGRTAQLIEDGRVCAVKAESVHADVGDVVVLKDGIYRTDAEATARRREQLAAKKRRAFDR